jgi:GTP-binding protein
LLKERISLIFSTIENIREELKIKISTSILNKVINDFLIINKPPKFNGGRIDISYATQIKGQVPSFVIFTNDPKYLHFTFARSIENQIRIAFNIKNVPIKIYYKDKNSRTRSE